MCLEAAALVEGLAARLTPVRLLARVDEAVMLQVTLLLEPLPADVAFVRLVRRVDLPVTTQPATK